MLGLKFNHVSKRGSCNEVWTNSSYYLLFQVSATDVDTSDGGRITYSIASGNQDDIFQIDAASGQLKVVQGQLIEYTSNAEYRLIIKATDG